MSENIKVGFIGLGHMGKLMAGCILKAGYALNIHDIRRGTGQSLEEEGAVWANHPKEVAARSDVVLTSLPGPKEVETVVLGVNGLFDGFQPGAGYIDTSTNAPETMRKIAEMGMSRGFHVLDAPVSGGIFNAREGMLTVFVGGLKTDFDRYQGLLQAIGTNVVYMGSAGSGNITKLVNNTMMFINLLGACESMAMGFKAGIDPQKLLDVIKPSMGQSIIMERVMGLWLNGEEMASTADLAVKDMKLGVELGKEMGIPLEISPLVEAIIKRFEADGKRSKVDMIAYVQDVMDRSGVTTI
jgi:3-hydroxyisobutyrate dehydrogenase-like beta-hydroxyacid dehydrogenase